MGVQFCKLCERGWHIGRLGGVCSGCGHGLPCPPVIEVIKPEIESVEPSKNPSETVEACQNCHRREKSQYSALYCNICGVASGNEIDAEAQKSPGLDKVNDFMEQRERYVRQLEDTNAKLTVKLQRRRAGPPD